MPCCQNMNESKTPILDSIVMRVRASRYTSRWRYHLAESHVVSFLFGEYHSRSAVFNDGVLPCIKEVNTQYVTTWFPPNSANLCLAAIPGAVDSPPMPTTLRTETRDGVRIITLSPYIDCRV